jgi:purine-binding chemotaxis protein CheW
MRDKPRIDWQGVRLRLERSEAALDKALTADAERVRTIFRQRAARLAGPLQADRAAGQDVPVLVFGMGSERYGIELPSLLEIVPRPLCAPVPGAPPQLAGVLLVRGEIHPVWELSRLLGLPDLSPDDPGNVLLLRREPRPFGLRVERVEGIRALKPEECGPARGDTRRVKWITPDLLSILDPAELLKEDAS